MKPIFYCPLYLLFILFAVSVKGQPTCTGSFGDPVIKQDFGSGSNPGAPLGANVTNYNYTSQSCPEDGGYTIVNSTNGCFTNSWNIVTHDHTGNPNGYFMLVNAANARGLFYTQEAKDLCPNTTYEFAAYIMNMIHTGYSCTNPTKPNITFRIEDANGNALSPDVSTGDIQEMPAVNGDGPWQRFQVTFRTTSVTNVVVKLINNAPGGCGNDLALDDITFRACGPQIEAGFGTAAANGDQNLCVGQGATYNLKADVLPGGYTNPVFQWQYNNNNTGWSDIAGQVTKTYNAVVAANAPSGVYQYRFAVTEASNVGSANCRTFSNVLTVQVNPVPVATAGPSQTVCDGLPVNLTATGGATYRWTGPNGFTSSQQNPVIASATTANGGTYSVIATSALGCASPPASTQVTVVPKIAAAVSPAATICTGESTQLSASGGVSYKWSPAAGLSSADIANPVASPAATTTYTVTITNAGNCTSTATTQVTVLDRPIANAGANKVIFEGQSVQLDGKVNGTNATYYWTPATDLDDPTSLTPHADPKDDITYTLHAVSSNGCGESTDNVFVKVYKQISIPNTFSPNNDGVNDTWNIEALITYPSSTTNVYDRYGQQVYKSIGYAKPWNGVSNGQLLPAASYYYVIDLKNGSKPLSGWVLIVR